MPHIKPTGEQIKRVAKSELDGPVVMLNLLKYDKQAKDGEGSGRDAYERYGDEMQKIMADRGIKLLWRGRADSVIIGDDGADDWHTVLLVEYPSRKVFLEMSASKEYEGVGKHRTSALLDSRLIACTEQVRWT
jgi:uncharacterized protein (DUF1330 family)